MAAIEEDPFKPHDVLNETVKTATGGFCAGLFIAATRNALTVRNLGVLGAFTRGAPTVGLTTAGPAAYTFFSRSVMNLRKKEDPLAAAIGGFMAGAIVALPSKSMPAVMGLGGFIALTQALFYGFGNRLDSFKEEGDEFERKEILRRTTKIPVAQTIAEIGEGRGIRPPGYEERRRQRILEKYGFEINPVNATVEGSR